MVKKLGLGGNCSAHHGKGNSGMRAFSYVFFSANQGHTVGHLGQSLLILLLLVWNPIKIKN